MNIVYVNTKIMLSESIVTVNDACLL